MSFVIHYSHAYAFIAGLAISKFTNMFSDVVITGLVLYIVTPEIYTEDRWNRIKSYFGNWFGAKQIIIKTLTEQQYKTIKSSGVTELQLTELPEIQLADPQKSTN